ncbi:hypothetical protein ABBQ38_011162 [Trebouxia sp. C0009 RCD-2024]
MYLIAALSGLLNKINNYDSHSAWVPTTCICSRSCLQVHLNAYGIVMLTADRLGFLFLHAASQPVVVKIVLTDPVTAISLHSQRSTLSLGQQIVVSRRAEVHMLTGTCGQDCTLKCDYACWAQ